MRLFLLTIGVLFIAMGSLAPIEGRQWVSKEPVGLPPYKGPAWSRERETVDVYHDSRHLRMCMKYSAIFMGCGLVFLSLKKPGPVDAKKFQKWLRKRKRFRERFK